MTILVATAEDSDSPVAMKLKKMWLKTPVSEEQAAQAVLDPAIGNYQLIQLCSYLPRWWRRCEIPRKHLMAWLVKIAIFLDNKSSTHLRPTNLESQDNRSPCAAFDDVHSEGHFIKNPETRSWNCHLAIILTSQLCIFYPLLLLMLILGAFLKGVG